jgi:hypothetical protein
LPSFLINDVASSLIDIWWSLIDDRMTKNGDGTFCQNSRPRCGDNGGCYYNRPNQLANATGFELYKNAQKRTLLRWCVEFQEALVANLCAAARRKAMVMAPIQLTSCEK